VRSMLGIEVKGESLVRLGAELAVAGFFADQRPLRGGAGVADWRLCGWISGLAESRRLRGDWGECALLMTHGRLGATRLLLLGLGARARFGIDAHRAAVQAAVEKALALGAGTVAFDLPAPALAEAPIRVAKGLVVGACAALDARPGRLLLRLVAAPGQAPRLRAALDEAASTLPRGSTTIRLLRAPVAPGGAATRTAKQPARPGARGR
jgi:hypothetical protein